ncbi:hypothetical protein [Frigidibacter mobilis]|uniref:hypothetical protein n=1 Tax=Frigidibacter mobilis TaxID=1335048 RepID=UPI0014127B8C
MGAHLGPDEGRAVQQLCHCGAGLGQLQRHVLGHPAKPALGVEALPVAGGMVHHRDKPHERAGDGGIGQGNRVRVADLAAQVQQVIGAKQALGPALLQRCHQRHQQVAPLGALHRGADTQAVQHRRGSARDHHRIMCHQCVQEIPLHAGARKDMRLDMVGMHIDNARDQEVPAKV